MRQICSTLLFVTFLSLGFNGCSSNQHPLDQQDPLAECPVCRQNNDLGCMEVRVNAKTPRVQHDGQTFYFCSEDCKKEFLTHPEQYGSK